MEDNFSIDWVVGESWFWNDSSVLQLFCVLIYYCHISFTSEHQASDQGDLGSPALEGIRTYFFCLYIVGNIAVF